MGGLPSDKATYSLKRRRTYGRGDMAGSFVFVVYLAVLAPPILAAELSKGLELAEVISTRAVESMKNDMSINFLEAALLQATMSPSGELEGSDLSNYCASPGEGECPWPTYSLMDADGVLHSCTVYEEPPEALELSRKTSSGRDVATALDRLNGRCAMLTESYWNYEWCHRKTIKQFHHVDDESVTVISLGKYRRTEVKRANVADTEANAAGKTGLSNWLSRVLKRKRKDYSPQGIEGETPSTVEDYSGVDLSQVSAVLDFYEDGSICKETGKPRQAQVLITCCAYGSITFPPVLLVSIEEVTICNYLLRVCSSELCPEPASRDGQSADHGRLIGSGDSPSRAMPSGVMEILDSLEACFPTMHVDYWSYQVCLSKGIQQYHVDLDTNPEGKQFVRDSVHYSLGEFNQLAVEDNGESLIGEAEDGKPAIVVEFEGGTECDLTGVLRSSTVYLKCGVEQALKEIVEDRTCHYKIEAESPLLCRHKRLMQKREPTRKVKCVVEGESDPETKEGESRSTTQGSGRT